MTDLLDRGVGWMVGKLATGASVTVIYRRGDLSVCLPATQGKTEYQAENNAGNSVTLWTNATFHVDAELLILGSEIAEPEEGDTVDVTNTHGTRTYEVAKMGNLQQFDRDSTGRKLSIHTNAIDWD